MEENYVWINSWSWSIWEGIKEQDKRRDCAWEEMPWVVFRLPLLSVFRPVGISLFHLYYRYETKLSNLKSTGCSQNTKGRLHSGHLLLRTQCWNVAGNAWSQACPNCVGTMDRDPRMHLYINKHHSRCEGGMRAGRWSAVQLAFHWESCQAGDWVCAARRCMFPQMFPALNHSEITRRIFSPHIPASGKAQKGMADFKNTCSHSQSFYMMIRCIPEVLSL